MQYIRCSPEVMKELKEQFSYNVQGAEYTDEFNKKEDAWNGKQYCVRDNRFTVGLLDSVTKFLNNKLIEVKINDMRQVGESFIFPVVSNKYQIRQYQEDIIRGCIPKKTASAEVATGGGKSLIIADIIYKTGLKTLVIVPSIEILKQMESNLSEYLGVPIGVVGGKREEFDYVTVSTWQSLHDNNIDYFNSLDCLIVDEAQHIGAPVLRKIAYNIPATYRFGILRYTIS